MHEATKKFGRKVKVSIGEPIPWASIEHINGRQELTDTLYQSVQSLRGDESDGFKSGLKRTKDKLKNKLRKPKDNA